MLQTILMLKSEESSFSSLLKAIDFICQQLS